jgi:hypothetical protein
METVGNKNAPKNNEILHCELCDFKCSKQSDWSRHITTLKHQKWLNGNGLETFGNQNTPSTISPKYSCEKCQKEFKNRSGLWKHKQKCIILEPTTDFNPDKKSNEPSEKELIMILIKENCELKNMMMDQHTSTQNMMMEVIKTGTHNTNNINNSHNKTFNLHFFLNETCKDAMNITEFVNSIQLQLSDLEKVGELGYVDGISNIIMKNLKQLDVTKRPVHCTDKKREVLYVKDENKWEKEDTENKIIRKAIKKVSHKNILMLPQFKDAHPDCSKSDSKYSDQYNKIIVESFGGPGNDNAKKEDKIIKNLTKTIIIERESETL